MRAWYTEAQERAELRQKWQRGLKKSTKSRLQEDEQRSTTKRATRSGEQPGDCDTSWQPFTCDNDSSNEAKTLPDTTVSAPLTETTSLIYHDPCSLPLHSRKASSKWMAFFQGPRCGSVCVKKWLTEQEVKEEWRIFIHLILPL